MTKEIYGQENSVSECLVLGKFTNYLGNTSRLIFQKEGDRHGGAQRSAMRTWALLGRAWSS